jgi:hypothetical protein
MGKRSRVVTSMAIAGVALSAVALASVADAAPKPNGPFGAHDDAMRTVSGAGVSANVLTNDTGPPGSAQLTAITQPANGAVFCVGGACTYTPRPHFVGTDTFTYTSSDGAGATSTASVVVTVNDANSSAAARALVNTVQVPADATTAISVLRNATDRDGNPFQILSVRRGGGGRVELTRDGRVLYTAPAGFIGSDSIGVSLSDGHGGVRYSTVIVQVG